VPWAHLVHQVSAELNDNRLKRHVVSCAAIAAEVGKLSFGERSVLRQTEAKYLGLAKMA
jgi:hypothetical protein